MTISSTTNTVSYTGNASTTAFAVPYAFFGTGTTSEIQVVEVVIATGVETVKSNGSDYTVAGGSGTTGTVTATVAPASTVKWVINRATTQTQETDYVENDPFPAESHEEALDRLTAIDQEQQRALDRTAQLPDGYTGVFDPTLPTTITGSTVLAFNAGATAFEVGPTTAAISAAAANATAAAASATAAAASETAAAASETAAAASETAAGLSETAAAASETAAAASETASAASETAAGLSETAAAASETAAGLSETAAGTSETNAGTSASSAATSASNAATSETNAAASETAAAASAASASAANLPADVDVAALDYLRRNVGDTAYEARTPAEVLSDISGIGVSTSDVLTNKTIDADGTGNVLSNIDIGNAIAASQAEAEAGTDNTKLVTSLRVAQAITALAGGPGVAKAWVSFNGTGTVAINASHNVASITDNGAGDYTINFTTAFSSAYYGFSSMSSGPSSFAIALVSSAAAPTAAAFRMRTFNTAGGGVDATYVGASFFGDQ